MHRALSLYLEEKEVNSQANECVLKAII